MGAVLKVNEPTKANPKNFPVIRINYYNLLDLKDTIDEIGRITKKARKLYNEIEYEYDIWVYGRAYVDSLGTYSQEDLSKKFPLTEEELKRKINGNLIYQDAERNYDCLDSVVLVEGGKYIKEEKTLRRGTTPYEISLSWCSDFPSCSQREHLTDGRCKECDKKHTCRTGCERMYRNVCKIDLCDFRDYTMPGCFQLLISKLTNGNIMANIDDLRTDILK